MLKTEEEKVQDQQQLSGVWEALKYYLTFVTGLGAEGGFVSFLSSFFLMTKRLIGPQKSDTN